MKASVLRDVLVLGALAMIFVGCCAVLSLGHACIVIGALLLVIALFPDPASSK